MSRTRATALALVNWRGVFYERYLLDRHVTALEGTNGAGKTTVMIAAYVVLLPDMSRLRFTNLGESGERDRSDKGIWGRLGSGGPSYALLDFELAGGHRLVAGVHLERKSEPAIDPTPFVITGLAPDVRMQDLVLLTRGEDQQVPELPELRENVARLAGRLQPFTSVRDYHAALFTHGVMPLRLSSDEERNKLNEMLRTSMTGGISRSLTTELRSFLLKEEGGLADTLQRVRANLDACRRTRAEVHEQRGLEREITDVFVAGQRMFAAAFLATRERADERKRALAEARVLHDGALAFEDRVREALELATRELDAIDRRMLDDRAAADSAAAWAKQVAAAVTVAQEELRTAAAHDDASAREQSAATTRATAREVRARSHAAHERAQADHTAAARGLADFQAGVAELHRRAGAWHQVRRRLREGEDRLGASVAEEELEATLARTRATLTDTDRQRRGASTRLADAAEHRRRHAAGLAALRAWLGDLDTTDLHSRARDALHQLERQRLRAEQAPTLARELAEAKRSAERQAAVAARAKELAIAVDDRPASERVRDAMAEAEQEQERHTHDLQRSREQLAEAERARDALDVRQRELSANEPAWRELQTRATRLGAEIDAPVNDRSTLDRARAEITERLQRVLEQETARRVEVERLHDEARELLAAGGPFDPALLRLRDELGADLVAASFEDVDPANAGVIEARLGPLARALVVDRPSVVAERIGDRADALADVWLVARDASLQAMTEPGERRAGDVIVDEGLALRVSRISPRPTLGRRARESRAAELRLEADRSAHELEALYQRRVALERLRRDGDELLSAQALWLAADPAIELAETKRRLADRNAEIERARAGMARAIEARRAQEPRVAALRAVLADSVLLDPPDYAARANALELAHGEALTAAAASKRAAPYAEQVRGELEALRMTPLSDADEAELALEVMRLASERDRLDTALDALAYVLANRHALAWSDAPVLLLAEQALAPALERQVADAEVAQRVAKDAAHTADSAFDQATEAWQAAHGDVVVLAKALAAMRERLASLDVNEPTPELLAHADAQAERLAQVVSELNRERDRCLLRRGQLESDVAEARRKTVEAEAKLAAESRDAAPAIARWEKLSALAGEHSLTAGVMVVETTGSLAAIRGHVNLVQEANVQRELLFERLRSAQGATTLLAELEVFHGGTELLFADAVLDLWLQVRDWLRRRLPAQIAEVVDPHEALLRLRDRLAGLEERLARQEQDLRGDSEDIARGIDVQVRKARGQVERLNKNLTDISFGGILGIRVRQHPVQQMEQVLRALREGAVQGLLFNEQMPIEAALDEVFRRHGGGRTGGLRLLDYREYLHLQVEIRRKVSSEWEVANPTRLSTGEAIGVGAALMMVVLTEWERDASTLRGKRASGSLRFLFLDEANRLSQDNLSVLFDLCKTLDLQLLIAAPEVARAEGNTTYRLVRTVAADGSERVMVSGRRTRTSPDVG